MKRPANLLFILVMIVLIVAVALSYLNFHHVGMTLVFGILCGYVFGAFTIHRNFFPVPQLKSLIGKVAKKPAAQRIPKARYSMFQSFNPQTDIVMIGNGIVEEGPWDEMFPNYRIANRGVGGDTAADILKRIDTILSVAPRKAFLMLGVNDAIRGHTADEIMPHVISIVTLLREKNIEVFLQSTIECSKSRSPSALMEIRKLNVLLEQYAKEAEITYIDLNEGLTSQEHGLLPQFTDAGIHLLGPAYVVWKEKLEPYISRIHSGNAGTHPAQ